MDDKPHETVFDATWLRPGVVAKGGAIALAAVGIGTGVLLGCWGASMFFNTNNRRLDVLVTKLDEFVQRPDHSDEVTMRVDDLNRGATKIGKSITDRLASIESSLEELKHRPIISGNPDKHEGQIDGKVINKQVTLFHTVPWDNNSSIVTGWQYANGASADQPPIRQYCYWTSEPLGGTTSQARVDLALNGVSMSNIGSGVPRQDDSLKECIWWRAS
jgi:hypothetical protein